MWVLSYVKFLLKFWLALIDFFSTDYQILANLFAWGLFGVLSNQVCE